MGDGFKVEWNIVFGALVDDVLHNTAFVFGGVGFNTVIPGFIERDVTQLQMTFSNVFPQFLRADQFALGLDRRSENKSTHQSRKI